MFGQQKQSKSDLASAAGEDGAVGGTAEEVGAVGGVEVAIGADEVAGAVGGGCVEVGAGWSSTVESSCAPMASDSFCTSVDSLVLAESASVCLALGEVWDEPLSESSELRYL